MAKKTIVETDEVEETETDKVEEKKETETAKTESVTLKVATCPGCDCGRLFYQTADDGPPIPLDKGNAKERAGSAVWSDPVMPTAINRQYVQKADAGWAENEHAGRQIEFLDENDAPFSPPVRIMVASNSDSELKFKGALRAPAVDKEPAFDAISGNPFGENHFKFRFEQSAADRAGFKETKAAYWDNYRFVCQECGTEYVVGE